MRLQLPPHRHTFQFRLHNKKITLVAVVALLAIGGLYTLQASRAASDVAILEPENGMRAGNASVGEDTSASGGKYVRFGAGTTAPPEPVSTAPAFRVDIRGTVTYVPDGDTVDVRLQDGTTKRIRLVGINAMENTDYGQDLSTIRGECHGVEATKRLHQLVYGKTVRVTALNASSVSGTRLKRHIAVQMDGQWRDVVNIMLAEGHGLWLSAGDEYSYNLDYSRRARQAAAAGLNLWDRDHCGSGPSQSANLKVEVNWNAPGDDSLNPNGEYIKITNNGTTSMAIGGWWVRDSSYRGTLSRGYTFPSSASIPAGGSVYVYCGAGTNTATRFYWDTGNPFDNANGAPVYAGDGAYLFDPQGDLRFWHQYAN